MNTTLSSTHLSSYEVMILLTLFPVPYITSPLLIYIVAGSSLSSLEETERKLKLKNLGVHNNLAGVQLKSSDESKVVTSR